MLRGSAKIGRTPSLAERVSAIVRGSFGPLPCSLASLRTHPSHVLRLPPLSLTFALANLKYAIYSERDAHNNHYPTVSPVPVGGYFWMFFTSKRNCGNLFVKPAAENYRPFLRDGASAGLNGYTAGISSLNV